MFFALPFWGQKRAVYISKRQMEYITNAKPGSGLFRSGERLLPFENKFPREFRLYRLMTTRPGEGGFLDSNMESEDEEE